MCRVLLLLPAVAACRLFIWILFIAAVASAGLQAWPDMGLILGVVVINVGIGLFQEGKAEKVRAVRRPQTSAIWPYCHPGQGQDLISDTCAVVLLLVTVSCCLQSRHCAALATQPYCASHAVCMAARALDQ